MDEESKLVQETEKKPSFFSWDKERYAKRREIMEKSLKETPPWSNDAFYFL
jgi:hypothetical protein